ncbi:MAG: hypothetical protein PUH33_04580 [Clostridiaceae bacterium]|nr:hypothetical protein [Clostridiaceae bacterium]
MKRALIAMSGGVDSSVAAYLIKERCFMTEKPCLGGGVIE